MHNDRNLSIGKEERFKSYKILANRTGSLLGPGTYNESFAANKLNKSPCIVKIHPFTKFSKLNVDGYIMIGNSTLYEPEFSSVNQKKEKEKFSSLQASVDLLSGISLANIQKFPISPNDNPNISINKRTIFVSRPQTDYKYPFYGCTSTIGKFSHFGLKVPSILNNSIKKYEGLRKQIKSLEKHDHVI